MIVESKSNMQPLFYVLRLIFFIFYVIYVFLAIGLCDIIMMVTMPLILVNRQTYRKITNFLATKGWPLIVFAFERIGRNRIIFTSDHDITIHNNHDPNERGNALVLLNHTYHCDWLLSFSFGERIGRIGNIKIAMKNAIKYVPLAGPGIWAMGFIFLSRKWQNDQKKINKAYQHLRDEQEPFWFVTHPEGSRLSETNLTECHEFSNSRGLPLLHNVLVPRVKGFTSSVIALREQLDYIYDLTVAYKKRPASFFALFLGYNPTEVHVHIKKIPICELPTDETQIGDWLYDLYTSKDQLLKQFKLKGYFPNSRKLDLSFNYQKYYVNLVVWLLLVISMLVIFIKLFSF
ncbi:putative acetyltransferase protein [Tieghemostelium lacteum]|uniref:Putative acetyltransferase protein n=1 Tax=Tieghemostelium lacteum TaxID=361077 RepID=A0A151Z9V6_TIELA|nr:putative acetyltransferase protein [Tieghemostelium lacteum]|eukprot:KYQ90713.1 putative acetyltransferase protein [Tieghemostelium lacteum]